MEVNFSLKDKFYSAEHNQPIHFIFDITDHEFIESEYVKILWLVIEKSGCKSVRIRSFKDYRGRYSEKTRLKISGNLPLLNLISGMELDKESALEIVLRMSFRKLISVNLDLCDKLEIRTFDDGIGAIIISKNEAKMDINEISNFFEFKLI